MEGELDEEDDDDYGDDNEDFEDEAQQYVPPVASNPGGSLKISIPFFGSAGVTQVKTQEQTMVN
jgi:hypothetical protein